MDHSEHGTEPSTAQLSPEELERKIMIAAQELMRKKMDKERREKILLLKDLLKLIQRETDGSYRIFSRILDATEG